MKHEKQAITLYLPDGAVARVREIAKDRGIRVNDAIRLALGLLDVADRARERGDYLGVSRHRENLETVIITPI